MQAPSPGKRKDNDGTEAPRPEETDQLKRPLSLNLGLELTAAEASLNLAL